MNIALYMLEAGIRAALLAAVAVLALRTARCGGPYLQRAVWRTVLLAALSLPLWMAVAPPLALPLRPARAANVVFVAAAVANGELPAPATPAPERLPVADIAYLGVAAFLLLRLAAGGIGAIALRRRAHATGLGCDVKASTEAAVPFAAAGSIILPADWHDWPEPRVAAVLAHERTHIAHRDPLFQLLAQLHRAVFWFSPLAWWVERRLAELAEEISDDAVIAQQHDRVAYAETLEECLRRAGAAKGWAPAGVAMARAGSAARRVERILDAAHEPARRLSRAAVAAVGAAGVPLLLLSAGVTAAQAPPPAPPAAPPPPPQAPQAPPAQASRPAFVLVRGDEFSVSGGDSDARAARALRSTISGDYLWFRRDGKAYVITDAALLKEAIGLLEPQKRLSERQAVLGRRQADLGRRQAELGERQASVKGRVPDMKSEIDALSAKLRDLQQGKDVAEDRIGEVHEALAALQQRLGEVHARMGEQHARLGAQQAELGAAQAELGGEQARLGAEQARLAETIHRETERIIDRALREGKAHAKP